ncbi:hypothetical protein DFJ74DRAFT_707105 [Hyaloraphidium curvatum]|nr:hypothetical protein DFJ74DRAFT_707105 [Hyaloraphidium curvatum]
MATPDTPPWSLQNVFQGTAGAAAGLSQAELAKLALGMLAWIPIAAVAVLVLACTALAVCRRSAGAAFAGMEPGQQLVTLQHATFAVVFGLQVVPYTWMFVRFMFLSFTDQFSASAVDFSTTDIQIMVGLFVYGRAFLYAMEAGLRILVKPNPIILLHHAIFFLLLALGCWLADMFLLKITLVLDLGAAHEFPLFAALVGHRIGNRRATRHLLAAGMLWYAATRVLQTFLLAYMLAACDPALRPTAPYVLATILGAALTAVQAYTFVIYNGVYRRMRCGGSGVVPRDEAVDDGSKGERAGDKPDPATAA